GGNDRHRHRVEHRATDGLQRTRSDQPAGARRQAAQQRAEPEDGEADQEDAPTVHCRPDTEACRSRRIAGSATLTMEMSITTTTMLAQQIASARNRRRRLSSGTRPRSPAVVFGSIEALMTTTLGFRACSKSSRSRYPGPLAPTPRRA